MRKFLIYLGIICALAGVAQAGRIIQYTPSSGAGSGDVTSSASSATDNAMCRADGTTGKTIQFSGIVVTDTNGLLWGVAEGAATQSPHTATRIDIQSQGQQHIVQTAAGSFPRIVERRVNGTLASPTGITSGQTIFQFDGDAHDGTIITQDHPIQWQFIASETWTDTSHPTQHEWKTTPSASITPATVMALTKDGYLGVGTTTTIEARIEARGTTTDGTTKSIRLLDSANAENFSVATNGIAKVSSTAPMLKFSDTTASAVDYAISTDTNLFKVVADTNDDDIYEFTAMSLTATGAVTFPAGMESTVGDLLLSAGDITVTDVSPQIRLYDSSGSPSPNAQIIMDGGLFRVDLDPNDDLGFADGVGMIHLGTNGNFAIGVGGFSASTNARLDIKGSTADGTTNLEWWQDSAGAQVGSVDTDGNATYLGGLTIGSITETTRGISVPLNDAVTNTHAIDVTQVGSGDASANFLVSGGAGWGIGTDNSDSDAFIISRNDGVGSIPVLGTNKYLRIGLTEIRAYAPFQVLSGNNPLTTNFGSSSRHASGTTIGWVASATDSTTALDTILTRTAAGSAAIRDAALTGGTWTIGGTAGGTLHLGNQSSTLTNNGTDTTLNMTSAGTAVWASRGSIGMDSSSRHEFKDSAGNWTQSFSNGMRVASGTSGTATTYLFASGAQTLSTGTFGWVSASNATASADTMFQRLAAGSVAVGNNAVPSTTGVFTIGGATSGSLTVGSSAAALSDAAGTLTMNGVDAIDATTETTIENAMDTFGAIEMVATAAAPTTIDRSNDGILLQLQVANSNVGDLTCTAGVCTLTAMTGAHIGIPKPDVLRSLTRGMVVEFTGMASRRKGDTEPLYDIAIPKRNSARAFGTWWGTSEPTKTISIENPGLVLASGNGKMLVECSGGDVIAGDYIVAGDLGYGEIDLGQFDVANVVAQAAVDARCLPGDITTMVDVLYTKFERVNVSALLARIEKLEAHHKNK